MKTGNDDGGDSLPTVAGREGLTVAKREIRRDGNGWHGLIPKPEGLARGRACIGRGDGLEDDVDRAGWAASLAGVHEQPIAWALIRPGRRSREEGGGGRRKRREQQQQQQQQLSLILSYRERDNLERCSAADAPARTCARKRRSLS